MSGPFPAEATFVGYPNIDQTVSSDDKPKNILKPVEAASESVPVKSPEAANKQYTILQPASMRSRAANVLQETSRDNSSNITSDSDGSKGPVTTATGTLSPNSMGRGKQHRLIVFKTLHMLQMMISARKVPVTANETIQQSKRLRSADRGGQTGNCVIICSFSKAANLAKYINPI